MISAPNSPRWGPTGDLDVSRRRTFGLVTAPPDWWRFGAVLFDLDGVLTPTADVHSGRGRRCSTSSSPASAPPFTDARLPRLRRRQAALRRRALVPRLPRHRAARRRPGRLRPATSTVARSATARTSCSRGARGATGSPRTPARSRFLDELARARDGRSPSCRRRATPARCSTRPGCAALRGRRRRRRSPRPSTARRQAGARHVPARRRPARRRRAPSRRRRGRRLRRRRRAGRATSGSSSASTAAPAPRRCWHGADVVVDDLAELVDDAAP